MKKYNVVKLTQLAVKLAQQASEKDEVPVGAIIFDDNGNIIAESENRTRRECSVSHHAELDVINKAGKIKGSENLSEYNLITTLEPCAMCAQAIAWAKIKKVYILAKDEKSGGVYYNAKIFEHSHHKPEIILINGYQEQIAKMMKNFFISKRDKF